ncbi:PREDICTED: uncharacterized protein LOC106809082 [Priapulus caudatus]|uniref:L-Fucosyltransferase n=1 Tax=Priapulus caudatus TaxID=37621 RepID=A0ABM1E5Q6_PRICU|nr:PREDICTED: uncharacterized protein LOC106809082 [Priapulus caudatus]
MHGNTYRLFRKRAFYVAVAATLFLVAALNYISAGSERHLVPNEVHAGDEAAAAAEPVYISVSSTMGGLGNRMWEYASMYGLALTNNMTPAIERDSFLTDQFAQLTAVRLEASEISAFKQVYFDHCCKYYGSLCNLVRANTTVGSFLQSYKYFNAHADVVRRQFVFDRRTRAAAARLGDVVFVGTDDPLVDMCALSDCDHVIMTVGTFGWWAGFLSGGDVIYFAQPTWPGSMYDNELIVEDYYRPEWIGME